MMAENQVEKGYAVLKAELMREVKALYTAFAVLTTGSPPEVSDDFENLPAEKLAALKQKLKQKLDAALTVTPSADVRVKSQQK